MAAPPIIKSAAHIPGAGALYSPPMTFDFLLSEAVSYRSRAVLQVPQGTQGLYPGVFVDNTGAPAAAAAGIYGIVGYATNPVDGPVNVTCIVRDAEVIDAYLMYGALDPVAVAAQLETRGIIVRAAVLPNTQATNFAPDLPPAGPPVSGIQSLSTEPPPEGSVEAAPTPAPTTGSA